MTFGRIPDSRNFWVLGTWKDDPDPDEWITVHWTPKRVLCSRSFGRLMIDLKGRCILHKSLPIVIDRKDPYSVWVLCDTLLTIRDTRGNLPTMTEARKWELLMAPVRQRGGRLYVEPGVHS